jgi:copper resistance protein B
MEMMWPTEPPVGNEPPPPASADYAADRAFDPATMRAAREQLRREHGGAIVSKVMANLLEYQIGDDAGGYRWDAEAWIGGDIHRLVVKSEGEGEESGLESGEVQVLYSRAIGPYFDAQAGVRYDFEPSPNRTYATLGVEGVAPYWFEVDGALFLSDRGELLGRVEGSYDLRLTQRLILEPRAELNLSAEDIPELGVGSGLSDAELGLRLRYEIRREFAPYVGVSFDQKYGDSAAFARAAGEDASESRFVVGLRAWF